MIHTLIFLSFNLSFFSMEDAQNKVAGAIVKGEGNCSRTLEHLTDLESDIEFNEADDALLHYEQGKAAYCAGDYEKALNYYLKSIRYYENEDIPLTITIYNLIGTLHKKQGDYGLASNYFQTGLRLSKDLNHLEGLGNSLNNLGLLSLQKGNIDSALVLFRRSTAYKISAFDTLGLSYNYDNLAQAFSILERKDSAYKYFELAIEFKNLSKERTGKAIVQNNFAEQLLKEHKLDKAEELFSEALLVAKDIGFKDLEDHILLKLSELYEKRGQAALALKTYKSHIDLKDSLFNIERVQVISEIETKYETEKKEQALLTKTEELIYMQIIVVVLIAVFLLTMTIIFLQKNRTKLKQERALEVERAKMKQAQIEAAISSQEKERKRFARDLHDGFGQLISVLNLNLATLQNQPAKRQEVFDNSTEILDQMYKELKDICFNLMPETLIKNGIVDATQEFADRVNAADKIQIETNFFGLEERLTDVQEISLYRITQEWVNNVIKYSDAQNITIQLTKDEEELNLLIEDNGMGFDKSKLTRGSGNGWKNLNSRANLIKGELELDTLVGRRGSTLIVVAPAYVANQNTIITV
ncbi:MAG: signal transduction histidine kinase [Gammaproteobacteria bacterium]|jgi:signal transduction histidine kinase